MATVYIKLNGTSKWTKVYEPDEYSGDKRYIMQFYPADGGEWEKFTKSGLQLKVKEDEDGKFITLRRPERKLIGDNLVIFSPPEIKGEITVKYVDQNGDQVRSYNKGEGTIVSREGDPKTIGNGSSVSVDIAVYDTQKGKGHRLESITVTDLVTYVAPEPDVEVEIEEEPEVKPKSKGKAPW